MSKELKLYCFAQSGNAYKVALFLQLGELKWSPIFVDFFKGETRSDKFRKMNPMGEVPVLVDNNKYLSQSGSILNYLTKTTGLFEPDSEDINLEVNRWLLWDNYKLTPNLATGRFMSLFLPEEKRDKSVINFLLERAKAALKVLDQHLDGREFVVGEKLSIADFSIAGYIFFTDEFNFDISKFPNVTRWRDRLKNLEKWKHPYELMPGYPLKK